MLRSSDSSNLQLITAPTPSSAPEPRAKSKSRALIRRDSAGVPGKTLGRLYSFIGAKMGSLANGVARRRGKGPGAAAEIILEFFSQEQWKEESITDLHSRKQIPTEVLAACSRLVKFAFRSQTPKTQYTTFQKIVVLSTQFPGLKTFFEESEPVSSTIPPSTTRHSQNDLFRLWDRPDDSACDPQWHFFCEFAAACIADQEIFALIVGHPPAALSSAVAHVAGLSFIEHLLNASVYDPKAPFSSHLSIRYLGSILNLKHFWEDLHQELPVDASPEHSQLHSGIVDKLLRRGESLLQDLGVDESGEEKTVTKKPLSLDEEGVDAYCQAVLLGLQTSFLQRLPVLASIATELWYHNLRSVVNLLRQQKSKALLPKSREIALNETYAKHLAFNMEDREVNVESDGASTDSGREGQGDAVSPSNASIRDNGEASEQPAPPSPQASIVERTEVEPPVIPSTGSPTPYDSTDDHASIHSSVDEGLSDPNSSRAESIQVPGDSVFIPASPISPTPSTATSPHRSRNRQSSWGTVRTPSPASIWSRSTASQDESDPTELPQIHPLLNGDKPSPNIFYDLALSRFHPLQRRDVDAPWAVIPIDQMYTPALHPPHFALRIVHPRIPQWPMDLSLPPDNVDPNPPPISLGDILIIVHRSLHTRISHSDWAALDAAAEAQVTRAFQNRCRSEARLRGTPIPELRAAEERERSEGVKRVDYLLGDTLFKGLVRLPGTPAAASLVTDRPDLSSSAYSGYGTRTTENYPGTEARAIDNSALAVHLPPRRSNSV